MWYAPHVRSAYRYQGGAGKGRMVYHLLYPLSDTYSWLNVFRYITFRTIYASITALAICFILGPWVIGKLRAFSIGQPIRNDGPDSHLSKEGTPTMGGLLIIFSVVVSTLLWVRLTVDYVWIMLMVMVGFGLIGFWDEMESTAFVRDKSRDSPKYLNSWSQPVLYNRSFHPM